MFLWLLGLAPSNLGLQELNNQLRYGQYHLPMGVDGLASLDIVSYYFRCLGWEWELTDVTLAWRDRQQVEAHKVIQASASQMLDILYQILYAKYCMLNIVC